MSKASSIRAIGLIRWNWPLRGEAAAIESEAPAPLAASRADASPFERNRPAHKPLPEHFAARARCRRRSRDWPLLQLGPAVQPGQG